MIRLYKKLLEYDMRMEVYPDTMNGKLYFIFRKNRSSAKYVISKEYLRMCPESCEDRLLSVVQDFNNGDFEEDELRE